MFPLPGAPRQQPMDPSRLKAFMDQPAGTASNAALKPSNARQSKRLFVYNLPLSATEESIIEFFNLQLNGLNVTQGVDPCVSAQLAKSRDFALVEFRTPSDATVALALNGIHMEAPDAMQNGSSNGASKGLAIHRPKDYIVPSAEDTEYQEGVVSTEVPDTANKVCVSNIPLYLSEEQVTELLSSFGPLKAFVLVKDRGTEESRGFAFCEYVDPANTAIAVEGLNGMELGDKVLKVNLASIGFTQASGLEMGVNAMSMFAGTTSTDLEEGRVLQLLNMVTAEELIDNDEYDGKMCFENITQLAVCLTFFSRNQGRHHGRMPEIRPRPRYEGPSSIGWKQTISRGGQDLRQVRHPRICRQGAESTGRKEVC
jgi:splicing factor U2AF 65 kDa subunit